MESLLKAELGYLFKSIHTLGMGTGKQASNRLSQAANHRSDLMLFVANVGQYSKSLEKIIKNVAAAPDLGTVLLADSDAANRRVFDVVVRSDSDLSSLDSLLKRFPAATITVVSPDETAGGIQRTWRRSKTSGQAWFVQWWQSSGYDNEIGQRYAIGADVGNRHQVSVGDLIFCYRSGEAAKARQRLFGVGRVGHRVDRPAKTISGAESIESLLYFDRYTPIDPETEIGEDRDPRTNKQNSIQSVGEEWVAWALQAAGVGVANLEVVQPQWGPGELLGSEPIQSTSVTAGKLWVVYVGVQSMANLNHSMPNGKWGWKQKQDYYDQFEPGDTIAFSVGYTGGSPRVDLEHFREASFDDLVFCRVTSNLVEDVEPYWPDEAESVVYPHRIEVERVESLGVIDIASLDERYGGPVADSFRRSAINQSRAILVEGVTVVDQKPRSRSNKEVVKVKPAPFAEVVESFAQAAMESGLHYGNGHDQLVGSFITALATKPFVILTGLSGSGKTRLALAFGQWLGVDSVQVVPVRPDWTSPDSLLGYEDALAATSADGKQRWVVPKTLEFILRAAANPTRPFVLVLDEMNLAHVERYFADVLSGMESGQRVVPDLELGDDGEYRARSGTNDLVHLPDNLFIVGTVNVDETTYMFSPKVLDRANTFEFRVLSSDLGGAGSLLDVEPGSPDLAAGFLEAARLAPSASAEDDTFGARLRALHQLLSKHDREFGHRTYHEAIQFARRFREIDSDTSVALDLQVLQKVLPRLHGSRRELTEVLNELGRWCFEGADSDVSRTFDTAATEPSGAKLPASYEKLHRMAKRLRDRHFVSFAE